MNWIGRSRKSSVLPRGEAGLSTFLTNHQSTIHSSHSSLFPPHSAIPQLLSAHRRRRRLRAVQSRLELVSRMHYHFFALRTACYSIEIFLSCPALGPPGTSMTLDCTAHRQKSR